MLIRSITRLIVLVLLTGCSRDPIQSYSESLARVLQEDLQEHHAVTAPAFPRVRDLAVTYSEPQINLLEFLALSSCELHELVGHRNSSLGRLAEPSQRLIYELNLLSSIDQCVEKIAEEEPDLAARLLEVQAIKKLELPARIFEATLAGDEYRRMWSQPDQLVDANLITALNQITQWSKVWLSGNTQNDSVLVEQSLQTIASGGGGHLLKTWQSIHEYLPPATSVLNARVARRPLCFPGMKTARADQFQQVVMNQFIGSIQRDLATVNKQSWDLLASVEALESLLQSAETPAYRDWRLERKSYTEAGRELIQNHVMALEPLMVQCGFLPAAS